MSSWYPLIHYSVFAVPLALIGLWYVLTWHPSIPNIVFALLLLLVLPALYAHTFQHADARHEALAIAFGFLSGYLVGFIGRFARRHSLLGADVPQLDQRQPPATRPWDTLPPEAREGLRAPGDLGVYDEQAQLQPLKLKRRPGLKV